MINALNIKNRPFVNLDHDLSLNFDILIWQEINAERTGKLTGLFKLLGIESETCKIYLLTCLTKFQSTIVKLYFIDDNNTENHFSFISDFLPLNQDLLSNIVPLHITKILSTPITRLS